MAKMEYLSRKKGKCIVPVLLDMQVMTLDSEVEFFKKVAIYGFARCIRYGKWGGRRARYLSSSRPKICLTCSFFESNSETHL